jgi:hypothetical protein
MKSYLNKKKPETGAWKITSCFMLAAAVLLLPDLAAAGTSLSTANTGTADSNNISIVLCNVILLLQGNIARGIAAGGVIFLGFSLFLGKISWGTAMALGIGLGAIFGAQQIVNLASGGGSSLNCV